MGWDGRVKLTREDLEMSKRSEPFDACLAGWMELEEMMLRDRPPVRARKLKKGMLKRWSWVTNSRGKKVRRKTWGKPGPPPKPRSGNLVAFNASDQWRLHRAAGVKSRRDWDRLTTCQQDEVFMKALEDGLEPFSLVDGYRHFCRGD